jgi:galactokinase
VIDLVNLRSAFVSKYGSEPRIFRAPGRINLIGEHTDHNDGFVLPAAIDRATYVAAALRDDRRIRVGSVNFAGEFEFDLDQAVQKPFASWAKYVQGVAMILERSGFRLNGADLLVESDVPIGAGLSSSAALEVSTAFAIASLAGLEIDRIDLARIAQNAEHEFAGVRSGIMDQFVSANGEAGHALFLDCRSLEWSLVPVSTAQFIVCNTMTKHDLAAGEYNRRREECDAAVKFFGRVSLRDVSLNEFESKSGEMPEALRKRARHVISENSRVLESVEALKNGELDKFGELIDHSHASLRDDFEVSCPELDLMTEITRKQVGVLGSRMIGGGFGGCTLSLVVSVENPDFVENVSREFQNKVGVVPEIYWFKISEGVSEID